MEEVEEGVGMIRDGEGGGGDGNGGGVRKGVRVSFFLKNSEQC